MRAFFEGAFRRRLAVAGSVTVVVFATFGLGFAAASHDDAATVHVCASDGGMVRMDTDCRPNEVAYQLATEAAVTALQQQLDAAETELADARQALEEADADLAAELASLRSAIGLHVSFMKIYDGGHYASYEITGTGFLPGTMATSGVGRSARVADDGTFSVFGGNLFCDRQVEVSGINAEGFEVHDSVDVLCDDEATYLSPAQATFTKIGDGGHYASYEISGSNWAPGSTVTSGVGTTATVADDGTFSLFGGNVFCDDDVTVSGTDANHRPVTRTSPVVCDSE